MDENKYLNTVALIQHSLLDVNCGTECGDFASHDVEVEKADDEVFFQTQKCEESLTEKGFITNELIAATDEALRNLQSIVSKAVEEDAVASIAMQFILLAIDELKAKAINMNTP